MYVCKGALPWHSQGGKKTTFGSHVLWGECQTQIIRLSDKFLHPRGHYSPGLVGCFEMGSKVAWAGFQLALQLRMT